MSTFSQQDKPVILLVESDPLVCQLLTRVLDHESCHVECSDLGEPALARVMAIQPKLIILASPLADMDGLDFLRRLRSYSFGATVPVIVLGTSNNKGTVVRYIKLKIIDYQVKSTFDCNRLLTSVRRLLGLRASQVDTPAASRGPIAADKAVTPTAQPERGSVDALRSIKPLRSRADVLDRIDACEQVKAMSPTVQRILALTSSANCNIKEVIKVISQDHALALKILRLANSAAFRRGDPVDTIERAVLCLGLEQVRDAAMSIEVIDRFSTQFCSEHFNFAHFWEHAIGCGVACSMIAKAVGESEGESFTAGLLHDVGRIVYVEVLHDEYEQTIRYAYDMDLPLEQVESRTLLINHADVMERVLHKWGFSRDLVDPIMYHHLSAANIRQHALNRMSACAALALANRITHAMLIGSSGNEVIYPTEALCEMLRITPRAMNQIEIDLPQKAREVKLAMMSYGAGDDWPDRRPHWREALGCSLRPICVSAKPEFDAVRMFCDTMTDRLSDEPPNIGIMHITRARDRDRITSAFRTAESKAEVGPLPMIVLSPNGNIKPLERVLQGRPFVLARTPITVARFISLARRLICDKAKRAAA
jgi:HD-like signal output (HDOD) protein/CheY-like chemotaxis protein